MTGIFLPSGLNGLPTRLQFRRHCMTFLGLLLLVDDTQAPRLGASAGPGDETTEGQGCLRRVAETLGDHSGPQGEDRGAVDADRGW